MAILDTLTTSIRADLVPTLVRAQTKGMSGKDEYAHRISKSLVDGSGTAQATGAFSTEVSITTSAVTLSLASSTLPVPGSTDVPSSDPEGKTLKGIWIENMDDTNYVTLALGSNALAGHGTWNTIIHAGGFWAYYSPAGGTAMSDGVDDEITLQANTASVTVRITYIFG